MLDSSCFSGVVSSIEIGSGLLRASANIAKRCWAFTMSSLSLRASWTPVDPMPRRLTRKGQRVFKTLEQCGPNPLCAGTLLRMCSGWSTSGAYRGAQTQSTNEVRTAAMATIFRRPPWSSQCSKGAPGFGPSGMEKHGCNKSSSSRPWNLHRQKRFLSL